MVSHDIIFRQVYSKLEAGLPSYLVYHCRNHTEYVVEMAAHIAGKEGCGADQKNLIKLAALYHDTGFLIGRNDHEAKSCMIAKKELEEWGFPSGDIEKICGMIMSTKIPQRPVSLSEKIVADADLFYLGTDRYHDLSEKLFRELQHFTPDFDERKWLRIQIDFLKSHRYHTNICRESLTPMKEKTLERLIKKEEFLNG